VLCQNGDLVRLAPGPAGVVDEIPAARLYKDGKLIVEAESRTVADRRRLSFAGIVSVALVINSKGELSADPVVDLTGVPETNREGDSMAAIAYDAVIDTLESLPRARRRDPDTVTEAVTRGVRGAMAAHWAKKPICHVHVVTV
jgi:ribonuclease J